MNSAIGTTQRCRRGGRCAIKEEQTGGGWSAGWAETRLCTQIESECGSGGVSEHPRRGWAGAGGSSGRRRSQCDPLRWQCIRQHHMDTGGYGCCVASSVRRSIGIGIGMGIGNGAEWSGSGATRWLALPSTRIPALHHGSGAHTATHRLTTNASNQSCSASHRIGQPEHERRGMNESMSRCAHRSKRDVAVGCGSALHSSAADRSHPSEPMSTHSPQVGSWLRLHAAPTRHASV